ncbi:sigma-w pathway protein ysdB [Bacillus sp. M6-12]|uniref:sigma-w pathway protein ysdB n=1 Tax=Bacillus sp. M6-12 TaxID=2054166 RepID=UPI000C75774E|nr:sigma-w pathway protein ysdB [Bacillus sp. M6-12]PLS16942.1 sigma-w pathway protein ysdB [Bacillus sp. M6-12]
MLLLIRLLLFALIIFIIYSAIKYVINPKRKLELAHEQQQFYFLDDANNVRKNFLLTYNGVLFEGEKYLGTTDNAFEVVSIFIWPKTVAELQGLKRDDFIWIEGVIKEKYPHSTIDWKSPVKEFLKN